MLDKSYLNSVLASEIIATLIVSVDLLKTFIKLIVGFGTVILPFISTSFNSDIAL
jgi:hypothetical protein